MPILDGVTLEYLARVKKEKSAFGSERLFGAVSWAVVSFTLGIAIDHYQTRVMYLYNVCLLLPLLASLYWFEISKGKEVEEGSEVDRNDCNDCGETSGTDDSAVGPPPPLFAILRQHVTASTLVFLLLCTVLSMGTSIVENLVFLMFTNTLGSSNFVCGVSVVVTVVFEIPLFFYAADMLAYFGPIVMLVISTLAYSIRVVGYTLVPESSNWMVLLLEPLHGVTFGCLKISSVEFISQATPAGYDVTVQGLLASLQGLGSLLGSSVGGFVEQRYGSDVLYRGAALIVAVFLGLFMAVFIAEYRRGREEASA
eukprot:CAMPEP_0114446362 /NCGR_PEP_ID=MMETSP0103-20121206/19168_1 /TAXON_ID=37642 ORGANISM="Paraphysomonas imperforata, Strain PA2" /NCGR_SAMPLE_ID=MMETSP0103 /ASSEMBLY_ACC=CAM_ASM_000201 /LENGTH=310 /DNA_ID=CAMNT_0001618139 /DNA_START=195 /DNA_END=1127 /DNA_ORIENTATION=-